jgi:hypothetical protein|nr:MAG TPA: bifunctional protein PutA [Caudoviricetes sp.]
MNKRRTTVYVDEKLYTAFNVYKQQTEENITFSEFVNKVIKEHLINPFNWNNQDLYNFSMNREGL